jgi:NADH-quinone oxidoreductase subunit J
MDPAVTTTLSTSVTASVGEQVIFWLLATFTVFFALFTMTRRNPVTAVMSLVATFFGLAAIYATLSAHFLAILQVLVYAGAIMVLFIFVVMILNREEVSPISLRPTRLLGVAGGVYLLVKFCHVVAVGVPNVDGASGNLPETFGTVGAIGDLLFRDFLYPFEAISLLLLVAIVGGVVVSRSHQKEVDATRAAADRKQIHDMSLHDYPAAEALPAEGHGGADGGGHH